MENLKRLLEEHPFLKGITPGFIDLIVGCAYNVTFDAGTFIFREGKEANQFYFIRHGKVSLEIFSPERGPVVIETLEEGEVLGWSWLIPPYRWKFDARAIDPVRAIAFDGKCLRNKSEEDHDLGFELLKRFAHILEERLQATRLRLLDLYGKNT